ncbi:MAG: methylated-DNA--[protein]-cysteine S-methyltransferase, partial [Streptococcus sp.]|nr:methylated-DNA--[protein]-cysteine S-methyltransferase [Streptococcus sp.]
MLRKLVYQSELGEIVVLANEKGLLGCYFLGQKYFEYGYEREKIIEETTIFLDEAKVWLDDYFTGKNPDPSRLTLVPYGTAFQRKVWKVLVQIPYGETMTYGEIAEKINCGSAQAVGGAVGKNPLSI